MESRCPKCLGEMLTGHVCPMVTLSNVPGIPNKIDYYPPVEEYNLSETEQLTKLIDELLTLFKICDEGCYSVTHFALRAIAISGKNNDQYPITMSLRKILIDKGYLEDL